MTRAERRHLVESPSRPPAVTGAIPIVAAVAAEPEEAVEAPVHRPSPYANLGSLDALPEAEATYTPRVPAPPSPDDAADPYAPPSEDMPSDESPTPTRAPWLPKENDND
jgi:hypothetical protein